MKPLRRTLWMGMTVLVWVSLAACQPGQNPTSRPTVNPTAPQTATAARRAAATSSGVAPTGVIQTARPMPGNTVTPGTPQVTPSATLETDPLRFTFPTQGLAPVSAWRPPLYPIPWAPTPYDHFYFARPIAADQVNWPNGDYRYGGIFFDDVVHTGVDIPAARGTPVLAAGTGRVLWAGYGVYRGGYSLTDPYGLAVVIQHDYGYQNQTLFTVYGHLSEINVMEGQHVETGAQIGLVGETGKVTGPHLHFEVRVSENSYFTTRNPELWISPHEGWGVLSGRIMDSGGQLVHAQQLIVTDPVSGQNWFARSYGKEAVNEDAYYRENVVIGDLPAGIYELRLSYAGVAYSAMIEILPGLVSTFRFYGHSGFKIELPDTPGADFTPEPVSRP